MQREATASGHPGQLVGVDVLGEVLPQQTAGPCHGDRVHPAPPVRQRFGPRRGMAGQGQHGGGEAFFDDQPACS